MSTQDPYGPSDPQRSDPGQQPSWQGSPERTGSSPAGAPGRSPSYPSYPSSAQQQPYGGQPHGGQPYGGGRPARRNGVGTTALVLGILGLLTSLFLVGGVLGVIALVMGVIGSRRAKRGEATNRGVAITGAVLGVVAALVSVAVIVVGVAVGSQLTDCFQLASQGASEQQINQCIADELGIPVQSLDS